MLKNIAILQGLLITLLLPVWANTETKPKQRVPATGWLGDLKNRWQNFKVPPPPPRPVDEWQLWLGAGYNQINMTSNQKPKGSIFEDKTAVLLDDVNTPPKEQETTNILPVFRLKYYDQHGSWELARQQQYMLGLKRERFYSSSKLTAIGGYGTGHYYNDLFTTGTARTITSSNRYGGRVTYLLTDPIMPRFTGIGGHVGWNQLSLDDDKTKQIMNAQNQSGDLGRSGNVLNYGLDLRLAVLSLSLNRKDFQAEGDADAFSAEGYNLGLVLPIPGVMFNRLGYSVEERSYKANHPVFNQTRQDSVTTLRWISCGY